MSLFSALVRNDLRLFFTDKRAVLGTLIVPIGIASFFGIVFGNQGGSKPASKIPVVIADSDKSTVSQKIVDGIRADGGFTLSEASAPQTREQVRTGKTGIALLIPEGFGSASAQALFSTAAPKPTLSFLYDPGKSSEVQMAQGLLTQQVMQVVSREAFRNPSLSGIAGALEAARADSSRAPSDKAALVGLLESVQRFSKTNQTSPAGTLSEGIGAPCEITKEAVVARNSPKDDATGGKAGVSHVFVGMAIQGLLFFAVDFGIAMVRDRRQGLWKRFRAAPLPRLTLVLSRLVSSAVIGLAVLAGVFAFGAVVFGMKVAGSVVGFLLMGVAASLMVAAFGLLIAALGRTEAQCRAASVPLVLAMSFLGGAWLPSFMMPQWVQGIAKLLPSRWAIDGFDAMTWRGLDLLAALPPVGVLLAFTAAFLGVAIARFRWE